MLLGERLLGRKRYRQIRWWCSSALATGLVDQLSLPAPYLRLLPATDGTADVPVAELTELRGAIHVHTTYSDGAGDFPTVIAAASAAGLDFLLTADHETLAPVADGWPGYHGRCLVLTGMEVPFPEGYLLAFGIPADFPARLDPGEKPQAWLDRVHAAGGWSVVALAGDPRHEWSDWSLDNFDGIEIVNLSSLARRRCNVVTLAVAAARYFGTEPMGALRLIAARPHRELQIWDQLLQHRPVMGIASVDAHARLRVGRRDLPLPRYEESFAAVQTHLLLRRLLTGRSSVDQQQVHTALRAGNSFMAFGCLADARGFRWLAHSAEQWALPGESICDAGDLTFNFRSPEPRVVARLMRDGRPVATAAGPAAAMPCVGPGTYRLELFLHRGRTGPVHWGVAPWILTNPIYVTPADVRPSTL